jgi:hypothetical protein
MTTTVVMFSHPSRAELRARTLKLLTERCTVPAPPIVVWTGDGRNDVDDMRALIASPLLASGDLLWIEDDVEPCMNALPYMAGFARVPHTITSFYNPRAAARRYGINSGFIFSQAFKVPAALLARMRSEPFPPPHPKQRDATDCVINRYLVRWDFGFWQHRSVVEHVGEASTWDPGATLDAPGRQSQDWPGPDVDALTFRWP